MKITKTHSTNYQDLGYPGMDAHKPQQRDDLQPQRLPWATIGYAHSWSYNFVYQPPRATMPTNHNREVSGQVQMLLQATTGNSGIPPSQTQQYLVSLGLSSTHEQPHPQTTTIGVPPLQRLPCPHYTHSPNNAKSAWSLTLPS